MHTGEGLDLDPGITPYTTVNLEGIDDFNVRGKTMKLPENLNVKFGTLDLTTVS